MQRWKEVPPVWKAIALLSLALLLTAVLALALRPGEVRVPPSPLPEGQVLSFPTSASTGSPPLLLNDERLFYEPGWGTLEVRDFLAGRPGLLGDFRVQVGEEDVLVADLIAGKCLLYGINPKVLLTLLEVQSGLVDNPNPPPEALDRAMGHPDEGLVGMEAQLDWAVRELFRGTRDYPITTSLILNDGRLTPIPPGAGLGDYAVLRVVARAGDESDLRRVQGNGPDAFVQTYERLFGEDPRLPPGGWSAPAQAPFLTRPYPGEYEVSAVFDHHYPFLKEDGSLISHLGQEAPGLPYDGHDGWDYALDAGVPVLAAADGLVLWSGASNDGCRTPALGVILDHGNGYQTLYWHLSRVDVQPGQRVSRGETLGLAGETGCADGPHLHFGVHFLGRETDPEGWCGSGEDPWALHPAGTASLWLWADRFSPCRWPEGAILVDEADAAFQRSGSRWSEGGGGVGGKALWAASEPHSGVVPVGSEQLGGAVEGGTWRPDLPRAGRYRLYAFIPYWNNATPDTRAARYLIHHAGGETAVEVDQALWVDRWVDLGVYDFTAGRQGFVHLDVLTDEEGFCVWFDALLWVPERNEGGP